jgi:hypothetical protein
VESAGSVSGRSPRFFACIVSFLLMPTSHAPPLNAQPTAPDFLAPVLKDPRRSAVKGLSLIKNKQQQTTKKLMENSLSTKKTGKSTMLSLVAAGTLGLLLVARSVEAQNINPGIIDPTNTYAGKTYSQWQAGFWQYYMSLPATNNPFVFVANHPVPLSTGQSGPVWFLCGNYANGGVHSYTNTIPGGIALFMAITDIEQDNMACPTTNNYREAVLRNLAKAGEDQATNMACTIDGVAVTALTNVLTTPYRVQSVAFSYTFPATHSVLADVFEETCYANLPSPYTERGAVEDGVFLLLSPLSAGSHVIHLTCAFPTFSTPFYADFTQYLTVQPVALTVAASSQPSYIYLSWPQTPDTYSLETSSELGSPDWQTNNLPVLLSNQMYQVTAPLGTTNQFFRLRLN